MTFEQLRRQWPWREIRGCPGRWVFVGPDRKRRTPESIVGPHVPLRPFRVPAARDVVYVGVFVGGGLLSYARADGTWLHTLNTEAGLRRKLAELGIDVEAAGLVAG